MQIKKIGSSPQELHAGRPQGDDPAGQPLPLHQRRGAGQLLRLHQAAGDAGGGRARPRRDDDTQAVVPAAPHRAAASIHHEADQEPGACTHTQSQTHAHTNT